MSAKKLILIVAVILGALSTALLALIAWALSPDAPAQDLIDRKPQRTVVTRTAASSEPTGLFTVSGVVVHKDDSPAPDVEIEARSPGVASQQSAFTDEAGRFTLELSEPAEVRPEDLPSTPWNFPVSGPRDDLRFVVPELCPVRVLVVDEADVPVPNAFAAARVASGAWKRRWTTYQALDEDGTGVLDTVACGVADLQAKAAGFVRTRVRDIDSMTTQDVKLVLSRGVELSGQVQTEDNEPIANASVRAGLASGVSGEDGHYSLRFNPTDTLEARVRATGFVSQTERLRVDSNSPDLTIDWILEASREVEVYCAGLPDDSCESIEPLMCTLPWVPFGKNCVDDDTTICVCPNGVSAIRGGGQSVEVGPDQKVAWLDFRADGGLRGRVMQDGANVGCSAFILRLPEDLTDVSRGGIAGRTAHCDDNGSFEVLGLDPGNYQVEVTTGEQNRRPDPVAVEDSMVDMGIIDLDGGTDIEGLVLDGLTGQGAPGEAVVALQLVADGQMPGTSVTVSRSEGAFVLRGLNDGNWNVFLATRPFTTVEVEVSGGDASTEPVLETGAADLLGEQGFGLGTDDEGGLVIQGLDADGSAADAGLEEGDALVGVTLMGMNLGDWLPGMEEQILDAVLEHYSGPGVGLVVERDGETVEVSLD